MIDPSCVSAAPRVGILGGSFNPAHPGHLHITEAARRLCRLDRVYWLVTPGNPLKSSDEYAPLAARKAHAEALTAGRPWLTVSDIEARWGTRYSIDTLTQITTRYPGLKPVWIMGADSLASFHRWRAWQAIAQTLPICVMSRPGANMSALNSPAARALGRYRLPERAAADLADCAAPAWVFLPRVHNPTSATALRQSGEGL